jgi:predicted translin family RNA/ssDNA-binding protein
MTSPFAAQFGRIERQFRALEAARRELQAASAEAQRASKQAIFALQRDDAAGADAKMADAAEALEAGWRLASQESRLAAEGVWRAALEEFAEAAFVRELLGGEEVPEPPYLDDPAILIGGLSDAVGELVRYAVRCATFGRGSEVFGLAEVAEESVAFLSSLDLTGPLRAKADQARSHLRRLEDVRYDVAKREP